MSGTLSNGLAVRLISISIPSAIPHDLAEARMKANHLDAILR
jgi:hypothetical protein